MLFALLNSASNGGASNGGCFSKENLPTTLMFLGLVLIFVVLMVFSRRSQAKKQKERIKAEKRKKYAKARKVFKVILIVLAVPLGAFIIFLLFGALLMALGY